MDNEEIVLIKMIIYKIYISSLTFRKYIIKMISNIIIDISHDEHNKLLCLTECLDLLKCILLGAKRLYQLCPRFGKWYEPVHAANQQIGRERS